MNLGPALAQVQIDADGLPRLVRVLEIGPDEPSRQRIGWGSASWRGDDGYVYVYGTANPERDLVFGWSLHVARVAPERIFDVLAWEYWTGEGWSSDATQATAVIPAVGGVSQTLSVFAIDGRWYAASKQDGFLGRDVAIWSARSPAGPFALAGSVAERPSELQAGIVRYAAIAHPTLFPEAGTVVVSVSRNATDPARVAEDPGLYRPEFLRVPLPPP